MTAYPPEPWDLEGTGQVGAWRVDAARVPALPDGARPLVARGRALAVTAFVDYAPTGLMAYHELLAGVLARHGRGVALSITDIWVDSEVSLAGGRGLWGIPKDLADFPDGTAAPTGRAGAATTAALVDGRVAARATYAAARGPALRLPLPLVGRVVQTLAGETVATRIRAGGRVRRASATWELPADGPLGWLDGARPVLHLLADPFSLTFGPRLRS
ncbi:acetoacetate decarboxylase family protein [Nocardioides perillae]|uniref:Acetoacetate decarboxylase n=1 Tax=Nocardioides perillae TaxID=1119534 RepID=A0A7Y9RVP6_9ACTN|nr:hypothetical protein [Nocardioides perillae]